MVLEVDSNNGVSSTDVNASVSESTMPVQLVEAVITTMVMGDGVNNTDADANGESGDNCNVNKNG